jgi:L-malate glycosyltransferase
MRVLWVVNIIIASFAEELKLGGATVFGGWVEAAAAKIGAMEGIELTVAAPGPLKELTERTIAGIRYIAVPESTAKTALRPKKRQQEYCRRILERADPDIIHVHGTEYPLGLGIIREERGKASARIFVSLQAVLPLNVREYTAGLFRSASYAALPLLVRLGIRVPVTLQRRRLAARIVLDREYLQKADAVCGRTACDRAYASLATPDTVRYIYAPEVLRSVFYSPVWKLEQAERYSIYVSNSSYSLKGLHHLLEAAALLVPSFPFIRLVIAGEPFQPRSPADLRRRTGYALYVRKAIVSLKLQEHVRFTGYLKADEVVRHLLASHLSVVASSAENSPNSLGEAMILGVPAAAAYAGGIPSMAEDQTEILFFPSGDPVMLAATIRSIFIDDELARRLSSGARRRALRNHDPEQLKLLAEAYAQTSGEHASGRTQDR